MSKIRQLKKYIETISPEAFIETTRNPEVHNEFNWELEYNQHKDMQQYHLYVEYGQQSLSADIPIDRYWDGVMIMYTLKKVFPDAFNN
jgi:hypothetical protein